MQNIISNPSFEANTTGWQLHAEYTRSNEDSYSQDYSVKQVSASGFNNFTTVNDATGWPIEANTDYIFTFWYKGTINSGLAVQWELNHDSAYGAHFDNGTLPASTSWIKKTVEFNSGAYTNCWFRVYNNNSDVVYYYDAFRLQRKTPSPTFAYVTINPSNGHLWFKGKRFQFVGVNNYPLLNGNGTYYTANQLDSFFAECVTDHIKVVRFWCFDKGGTPTSGNGFARYNNAGTLTWNEHFFVELDTLLDSAMRYGIKVVLPLVNQWDGREKYCQWSDDIYATNYVGGSTLYQFYDDANIRNWYKALIDKITARTNTVNSRVYSTDDTILAWELGNELRYDKNPPTSGQNTAACTNLAAMGRSGGWIDEMTSYIRSKDANHLIWAGDQGHFFDWVNGDSMHNGTQPYGVDFEYSGQLFNNDIFDLHQYPYNDSPTFGLQKYGQSYGFPNAVTYGGWEHQMRQCVAIAKSHLKPIFMGEEGVDKRNATNGTRFPAYPKELHYRKLFRTFFDSGGDGIFIWHYTNLFDDNNYNIKPDGVHSGANDPSNDNTDDAELLTEIQNWGKSFELNGRFVSGTRNVF